MAREQWARQDTNLRINFAEQSVAECEHHVLAALSWVWDAQERERNTILNKRQARRKVGRSNLTMSQTGIRFG